MHCWLGALYGAASTRPNLIVCYGWYKGKGTSPVYMLNGKNNFQNIKISDFDRGIKVVVITKHNPLTDWLEVVNTEVLNLIHYKGGKWQDSYIL